MTSEANDLRAIQVFSELIRNIEEEDYGDFMRKANSYLLDLKSRLRNPSPDIERKLDEMQSYTQFTPTWEVDPTRERLLKDAGSLAHLVY